MASNALRFASTVACKHLARDMAGDVHDGLVTCATLREFGDLGMSPVMPPASRACA